MLGVVVNDLPPKKASYYGQYGYYSYYKYKSYQDLYLRKIRKTAKRLHLQIHIELHGVSFEASTRICIIPGVITE